MPAKARTHSAFTLLELILVMVLVAITMALAAPSLKGFTDAQRVRNAAGTVLALIQYARTQAVAEGRPYRLEIDTARRAFRLTAQQGADFVSPATDAARDYTLDADMNVQVAGTNASGTANTSYITVRPDGFADPGAIRITGPRGFALDVAADSAADLYSVRSVSTSQQGGQL